MKRSAMFERCLALMLAISLALFVPAAFAVVKNLSIVDGEGNSLANTKVTIVFPDGTEVEEETDDDGMLYYDFPDDGQYTVKYPGGQMAVNVKAGGLTTGQWVGAGLATATIIGVGVVASDSGTKSSDSSSSSYSPPSDPGGGSSPPSFDVSICNMATYAMSTTVVSDPGNLAPSDSFDGNYEVTCPGPAQTDANITSQAGGGPSPAWSCSIGSGGDCDSFQAICSWNGTTTTCSLGSIFSSSPPDWTGIITVGEDLALPGGALLIFDFTATRQ